MKKCGINIVSCLLLLLVTVSLVTVVPIVPTVSAADNIFVSGNYEYKTVSAGCVKITKYIGSEEQVSVPVNLNGKLVTSIDQFAFYRCNTVEEVILPDSIDYIAQSAFSSCENLRYISISKYVQDIGRYAFEGCVSLECIDVDEQNAYYVGKDGVLFSDNMSELLIYPGGKTDTTYEVPQGVESIGELSFYNCRYIESVILPHSIKKIGDYAFSGCDKLNNIVIVPSVKELGEGAFYNCSALNEVSFISSVQCIEKYTFCGCESLESIVIPDGVLSIREGAFSYCDGLESIVLPSTLTEIEEGAFDGCDGLKNVYYMGSIKDWDSVITGKSSNEALFKASLFFDYKDEMVTVRIPVPEDVDDLSLVSVYRLNDDGTTTVMDAVYDSGYLVFRDNKNGRYELHRAEPEKPEFETGDVNADGYINVKDATAIQKHIAALTVLSDEALKRADYDKSGTVNIKDATAIQKFVAGII